MNKFYQLTKRNAKLFFKDKGVFICSMITPIILLVLYITFLGKVFKDSYKSMIPQGIEVSNKVLNGLAGGQLLSSLLSVSCVTISFCANMIMVQDKVTGARKDLLMTHLSKSSLSVSYYVATLLVTVLISVCATIVAWIYLAFVGWYLSFLDCVLILIDVLLLSMFGTALSSLINFFLTTQGQISAVGTIVSSMYGFICGAYMPIATFGSVIQKTLMFLPSTYGSSLVRNHCLRGALKEFEKSGIPKVAINEMKNGIDCNLYFFDNKVSLLSMYLIIIGTIALVLGAYVILNKVSSNKKTK